MAASTYTSIWIHDLRGQLHSRFTFAEAVYGYPVWSPDSLQIAFASTRTGTFNIYLKPANGAAEEKAIHPSPDDERPQSWSPDGKYLVFDRRATSRQGLSEVMVLPLEGNQPPYSLLNSAYTNFGGQVSPDGRWIAFASNQSGRYEICVSTFPEAKGIWQVSIAGGRTARWQRDGRALFYSRGDGTLVSAEIKPGTDSFTVGVTVPVSERHVAAASAFEVAYDVFPDGKRFVMASVKNVSMHSPLTLLTDWTVALNQ
jgi:eukaryotic-like serine/threonine-protein kinase